MEVRYLPCPVDVDPWESRVVTIGVGEVRVTIAGGGLAFDRDGEIVEDSPARNAAVEAIAARLRDCGGAALIIDETALLKRDTRDWLHGRIGTVARARLCPAAQ